MVDMIVIDGVRYRPEDAERLGKVDKKATAKKGTAKKKPPAANKARTTAATKQS